MIINKYGITLTRITEEDIEMVRYHRNSDFVRSKMFYQKIISKEAQKKWFQSINNDANYYFIIHYKNKKVGLVHGTITSFESKSAKGGVFIWEQEAINSHLPVLASVCMADMTFLIMDMNYTLAEVRMDNEKAIKYNISFGYKIVKELKNEKKVIMQLSKENYLAASNIVRQMVKRISNETTDLNWDDISFPEILPEKLYKNLPLDLTEKLNNKLKKVL